MVNKSCRSKQKIAILNPPPQRTACHFQLVEVQPICTFILHEMNCTFDSLKIFRNLRLDNVCFLPLFIFGQMLETWNINSHWVAFENIKFSKLQGAYAMCTPPHARTPRLDAKQGWLNFCWLSTTCGKWISNFCKHNFHKACPCRFCNLVWDKRPTKQKTFHLCFMIGLYVQPIQKSSLRCIRFALKFVSTRIQTLTPLEKFPTINPKRKWTGFASIFLVWPYVIKFSIMFQNVWLSVWWFPSIWCPRFCCKTLPEIVSQNYSILPLHTPFFQDSWLQYPRDFSRVGQAKLLNTVAKQHISLV